MLKLARWRHRLPRLAAMGRLIVLAMTLTACMHTPTIRDHGRFEARTVTVAGATHRYQIFLPSRAAGGEHPAVILFLHGSGERGTDNRKQMGVGLPPYVRAHQDDFPAIVVIPQSPDNESWAGTTADAALAALDDTVRDYGGDPQRITLTGLSRGGYGVYELAAMRPGFFAALVPVCGGVTPVEAADDLYVRASAGAADPFADAAKRIGQTPVWAFHGALDDAVPVEQSRRMIAALRAAGNDARYTEFPEAKHNAWDPAYATPELWTWVWEQRRR